MNDLLSILAGLFVLWIVVSTLLVIVAAILQELQIRYEEKDIDPYDSYHIT